MLIFYTKYTAMVILRMVQYFSIFLIANIISKIRETETCNKIALIDEKLSRKTLTHSNIRSDVRKCHPRETDTNESKNVSTDKRSSKP